MPKKRLSELINEKISGVADVPIHKRIRMFYNNIIENAYSPSFTSIFTIVIIFLIIFFVYYELVSSLYTIGLFPNDLFSFNSQVDFIAISGITGSFIAGIIIFIIGLSNDSESNSERLKSLLKSTEIFPIFIFFVLYVISYSLFKGIENDEFKYKFAGVLIILGIETLLLLIYPLFHAIKIRLKDESFVRNRNEVAKNLILTNFKSNLKLELARLLGINTFVNEIKNQKEFNLKYYPFLEPDRKSYFSINSIKEGKIIDIDLGKFYIFIAELNRLLLKKDINIKKGNFRRSTRFKFGIIDKFIGQEKEKSLEEKTLNITFNYSYSIKKGDSLVYIESDLSGLTPQDNEEIEKLTKNLNELIFVESSVTNERKTSEIASIKDDYIRAIETKALYTIERLNNLYLEIIEAFWKFLDDYNFDYDFKSSKNEVNAFPFDSTWSDIRQISKDIKEIIDIGMESKSDAVIAKTLDLNSGILYKTLNKKEPLLFNNIIFNFLLIYRKMLELEFNESKLQDILKHEIVVPLYETSTYYIGGSVKREVDPDKFETYQSFVFEIIRLYQFLLKEARDRGRSNDFKLLIGKVDELFKDFFDEHDKYRLKDLEQMRGSENDVMVIELKNKRTFYKFVQRNKDTMLFGFGSWLLKHDNPREIKDYIQSVLSYLPDNLFDLSSIYSKCLEDKFKRSWDWSTWNIPVSYKPTGFHEVSMDREFSTLFIIKSLQILSRSANEQTISPSRALVYRIEGDLAELIDKATKGEIAAVEAILNQGEKQSSDLLKELLKEAKEKQLEKENNKVIGYEVPQRDIDTFYKKIVEEVNSKHHTATQFFNYFGKYTSNLQEKGEEKKYGYNQIVDKEAFIKNWHVHYIDLEDNFAEGVVRFENEFSIKSILDKTIKVSYKKLKEFLINNPDSILISTTPHLWSYAEKHKELILPTGSIKDEDIVSRFKYLSNNEQLPIFVLQSFEPQKDYLIAVHKDMLPKMIQLDPRNTPEDNLIDKFYMQLRFMSHNEQALSEILKQNPGWLKHYKTKADKIAYLKTKGVFQMYERIRIEFTDNSNIGVSFQLKHPYA